MATVNHRGPYQWQVKVRRKGHPMQSRTFETRSDAEAWGRLIESEMDRGVFRSRTEAENTTLEECLRRYLKEVTPLKKGAVQEEMKSRLILRHPIASLFMANVRGADAAKYRDDRLRVGKARSTVLKELALISHLFTIARREWGMESITNPVTLISKPKVNNQRDRRLFPSEEKLLLAAFSVQYHNANIWLKPMFILALETGMRLSELISLDWKYVDLKRRVAQLQAKDTKNREARDVPLSTRSISVLEKLPRSISGKVLQTTDNAIQLAFNRAEKRACEHLGEYKVGQRKPCDCPGIEDFRFHDLRHEAISRFFELGLNPMQVAAISGHKTLQMLKRYTHLKAEDLAKMLG